MEEDTRLKELKDRFRNVFNPNSFLVKQGFLDISGDRIAECFIEYEKFCKEQEELKKKYDPNID